MKLKKKSLVTHAKRRLYERYGFNVTTAELQEIVKEIQTGKAQSSGKISNRVSNWIVNFRGTKVKVGYDRLRKCIITALPMEERLQDDGSIELDGL